MKRIRDRVAGLDVHRDTVVACVRLVGADGTVAVERGRFTTTTKGLGQLAEWLAEREVSTVGMEATGIYWRPVFYTLEGRFSEVWLCNPHHVKNVPGRKTDINDAEWLADVVAHGMVRASFVPPVEVREVREINRYRRTQINARAAEIQRLERLLQDAGIKLSSVASRVWSKSAAAMVEALIAGVADPQVLAELAKGRMRAKIGALSEALDGRFGSHHRLLARQILDHIAFLDATVDRLDAEIAERLRPFDAALALVDAIPGVGTQAAQTAVAETGVAMACFATAGHFASWIGLAPHNRESAGKHKPAGSGHGNRLLRQVLVEAALAASRTDTYLGAQWRRIARRRGPNTATVAVAHSIAVIIWHLWTTGEAYQELGADYFERRRNPQQEATRLVKRLQQLGYQVDIQAA